MYTKKAHIHFIGIGGIGMSGIAKILKQQGYTISGCDHDTEQKSIIDLKNLGCSIYQGNNTPNCHDNSIDILVYSSAIQKQNPEITAAQQRGIPTIPRALMLAELMRTKYSIAIAGAHGKTTTTSLISHILLEADYDPTVIVGGHLKKLSSNAHLGKGDFLVAEADESDRSFLNLYPTLAVITNIDLEHLDMYKDITDIEQAFTQFLSTIPFYGTAFVPYEDPHIQKIAPQLTHIKMITFGLVKQADVAASDYKLFDDSSSFTLWYMQKKIGTLSVAMPGIHNIRNALAAAAVCLKIGVPFESIQKGLATFPGVDRRFTFKGTYNSCLIYDDYAHHPEEIKHALAVARAKAKNDLIVIFQPHRYSRTYHLWNNFIEIIKNAHITTLIITDIYAASEEPIAGIHGTTFAQALAAACPHTQVIYAPYDENHSHILSALLPYAHSNAFILTLGAGKMNKVAEKLITTPT